MSNKDVEILYMLNTLENEGRELSESIANMGRMHESSSNSLAGLMKSLNELRLRFDKLIDTTQRLWDELLHIADQSYSTEDSCPEHIRAALKSAFSQLGYDIYGCPGTDIEDIGKYEIIYHKSGQDLSANKIIQTIRLGVRERDGSIVRMAKVVVGEIGNN